MTDRLAVEQDLAHLPELAVFAVALVLLIVVMNSLHASDTLAYLIAVGVLCSQSPWRPA